jgi:hypothetical protein
MLRTRLFATLAFLVSLYAGVVLAQSLPTQVLQLLARDNTWTGEQTFNDFRLAAFLPADTANRLYTDGTNLYWEGATIVGAGGVTTPHNLLSTTHPDTLAASPPTQGDLIVANATPVWARFAKGSDGTQHADGAERDECGDRDAGLGAPAHHHRQRANRRRRGDCLDQDQQDREQSGGPDDEERGGPELGDAGRCPPVEQRQPVRHLGEHVGN